MNSGYLISICIDDIKMVEKILYMIDNICILYIHYLPSGKRLHNELENHHAISG